MSTISTGPSNGAVRRMTRIGSVDLGVLRGGVLQPFTQARDGAPRVWGGDSGSSGGVGEAPPPADGERKGVRGGRETSRSHAAARSTTPTTPSARNLCMIATLERRETSAG
jgi:hypothetical protein